MYTDLIQKEWDATIKAFAEFSKADNIAAIAQIAHTWRMLSVAAIKR